MSLLARIPSLIQAHSRPLSCLSRFTTIAHKVETHNPEPASATNPETRPHHLVVSLSGQDRSGVVNSFAKAVKAHKANIEESKMAILGGDFAMIVYLSMENPEDASSMEQTLKKQLPNFTISMRDTTAPNTSIAQEPMWKISVEAPDQPGITAAVAQALATHGGHIHEMETETTAAPFAGYELFILNGRVSMFDRHLNSISDALTNVEENYGASIILDQISAK